MQLTESQSWNEIDPAMIVSYNENIADNNYVPLIMDYEQPLNSSEIIQFLIKGNSTFRLQDGFSIECNFSINNGVGQGGVPVRFIKIKGQNGQYSYCGVIYCNENDRLYYHQSAKSLDFPYVQRLLKVLINTLKNNSKPAVKFLSNNHADFK